jgi:hypothetical protein
VDISTQALLAVLKFLFHDFEKKFSMEKNFHGHKNEILGFGTCASWTLLWAFRHTVTASVACTFLCDVYAQVE